MVNNAGGTNMISLILAGGKGLRLWPESRKSCPKQLCKLIGEKSMLDQTIDRLIESGSDKIIIITNDELYKNINDLLQHRSDKEMIELVSEPEGRNTAPAVGLVLSRLYATATDDIIGIFPSDHHVIDNKGFCNTMQKAVTAAQKGHIVTIGVTPNRPETGYGYIEKAKWEIGEIPGAYPVSSFCEKPDLETAKQYLSSGSHMWNAGIYIASSTIFLEEFSRHLPELYQYLKGGFDYYINSYSMLPDISLDYGIAEKCDRMAVVTGDFGWCDLGSWNALAEIYDKDEKSNICNSNDVVVLNSHNCLVKQKNKTVVLFGVENLLLVETDDIILISDRHRSQDIREIVKLLQEQNREDLL